MAAKKIVYILTFKGNEHQWMMFDGDNLSESQGPANKNRHPVVALLPDPLFFFFKPQGVIKSRHAKSATMMQMNYSFPCRMKILEFFVLQAGLFLAMLHENCWNIFWIGTGSFLQGRLF